MKLEIQQLSCALPTSKFLKIKRVANASWRIRVNTDFTWKIYLLRSAMHRKFIKYGKYILLSVDPRPYIHPNVPVPKGKYFICAPKFCFHNVAPTKQYIYTIQSKIINKVLRRFCPYNPITMNGSWG